MPNRRAAPTLLLGTMLFGLRFGVHPQTPAGDPSDIRRLVDQYVATRDTGDPKAITALFTPEADQLVSSGEWRKGLEAVVQGTVASSLKEKGQRRSIEIESVRFIDSDVAIADGRYTLTSATGSRAMWTTIVAKRMPDGWRIAAIRNMLPAPPTH